MCHLSELQIARSHTKAIYAHPSVTSPDLGSFDGAALRVAIHSQTLTRLLQVKIHYIFYLSLLGDDANLVKSPRFESVFQVSRVSR